MDSIGSDFDNILYTLASGKSNNIIEAIGQLGFTGFGLDIPVGFGLSVRILNLEVIHSWCENTFDTFACEKLLYYGGAIPLELSFMSIELASGLLYFNVELGMIVVLKPNIKGILNAVDNTQLNITDNFKMLLGEQEQILVNSYGRYDYSKFIKMEEYLGNHISQQFGLKFIPVLWNMLPSFFDNWYYSGTLRRGRYKRLSDIR